jgi:tetraacyldisaccharide 4'-kinase
MPDVHRHAAATAERLWAGQQSRLARLLLAPLAALFGLGVRLRNYLYDVRLLPVTTVPVPVLSVGNLTVGGSGKTPFAGWLVAELQERGRRPAVLHGGYADDEPALHRLWHPHVPVLAAKDRVASARRAIDGGADVLVLDDGLQHRRLARAADIVLLSAEAWTPRQRLLPAGPWREPLRALRRAHLVVITRKVATREQTAEVAEAITVAHRFSAPIVLASIRPLGWRSASGKAGPPQGEALAVAGIARPEQFISNARDAGATIGDRIFFPDHHEYTAGDASRIVQRAAHRAIVTTGKDAVKLERLLPGTSLWVLEQEVQIEEGAEAVQALLQRVLA